MAFPGRTFANILFPLSGAVIPVLFYLRSSAFTAMAVALVLLVTTCYTLFSFREIKSAASDAATLFFGMLYVPLLLGFLVLLRNQPDGLGWIMMILLIVMSGDSAAYFIGCRFGKNKLYPSVSPNKSIEGAVGGLFGSAIGAIVCKLVFLPGISIFAAVVAAVLIGSTGQVGDLFESLLKRSFGVKDSGTIIPGHGGILDRLDSILFAAPVAYGIALFLSGRSPF